MIRIFEYAGLPLALFDRKMCSSKLQNCLLLYFLLNNKKQSLAYFAKMYIKQFYHNKARNSNCNLLIIEYPSELSFQQLT